MDPILIYAATASLAVILLLGALQKLRHFLLFESAVSGYALLPPGGVRLFSVLFLGAELLAGLMLLVPSARMAGAVLALAVLLCATSGIVINLLRGHRDIDCGCGGFSQKAGGLSGWLVVRNMVLAGLSAPVLLAMHSSGRPLSLMDGLTFVGATLAVLGLYFTFNLLIDTHTRFQEI
ncbi:MauE/DoxX family redox-associated membrane protein [Pusillimonas sp. SM2304]|uniref:MauE/DoxX family redox-associated membrane protein n=1 Tax=Pusillimonas sp. SM2304 TaxID=3073241 RepID=UPI002876D515|nr:MauE/DoxX family redox-associated membrane protein [Pusillimonas sp. SM2304]MDS1139544.1 MauE/DoxX family redox-associated membrane protein [Pusillimonas sp. SM2304]